MSSRGQSGADTESALLSLPRSRRGRPQPGAFVVHSECGVPLGAYPIGQQCRLGRSEDSEILLDDAKVSREHARIVAEPKGLLLEDLGSRNGTFVDGQPVRYPFTFAPDPCCASDARSC